MEFFFLSYAFTEEFKMGFFDGLSFVFCVGFFILFIYTEIVYIDTVWRGYGVRHLALARILSRLPHPSDSDAVLLGFVSRRLMLRLFSNTASLVLLLFITFFVYAFLFGAKEAQDSFFLDCFFTVLLIAFLFSVLLNLVPLFFRKKFWFLSKLSASNYYDEINKNRYIDLYRKRNNSQIGSVSKMAEKTKIQEALRDVSLLKRLTISEAEEFAFMHMQQQYYLDAKKKIENRRAYRMM